jgi:putative hemolysin
LLWAVLAALLFLSACLSASETALFSLKPSERARAGSLSRALLEHPRRLLAAILLANLSVNFLFFSLAARLGRADRSGPDLLLAAGGLAAVLVCGEILPKTLALRARLPVARAGAVLLTLIATLLRPAIALAERTLELLFRALGPSAGREGGVTSEDLARALEHQAKHGLLLDTEAAIVAGIAELDSVRVRELMTPRVDAIFYDVDAPRDEARLASAVERKESWIVAVAGGSDRVVGRLRVADLLVQRQRPARELVQPVLFVPEVASALHLLEFLREKQASLAVVVDEWGGTAGSVTIENVFEYVVGDLRVEGEAREEQVEALDAGRWRVPGSLSIRDWNEQFGLRLVPREFETVGGFVANLLGRAPRVGDEARAGGLSFRVRELRGRRIHALELSVDEAAQS